VFENRVLRRIFGPKRDEVTGGWRKLRNVELHNLCYSPSIIRMIKSKKMRWVGHVGYWWESLACSGHRGFLDVTMLTCQNVPRIAVS
jgi:hypothetical protein